MDKVIRITAGIFILIFVIFAGTGLYGFYVEKEYRGTLISTYSYTLTISASEELRNVTFFIPVPANPTGNSPIVEQFSIRAVAGMPAEWGTTLLGSDKATMVKIQAPVIKAGSGGGASAGITLSSQVQTGRLIDTRSPQEQDILLRPVKNAEKADCAPSGVSDPGASCYHYISAVYADYESSPNARVEISSTIVGKNEWKIFKHESNTYSNSIYVLMLGDNHGWIAARGELQAGIGSYNVPALSK
jgi:hypothetical protein